MLSKKKTKKRITGALSLLICFGMLFGCAAETAQELPQAVPEPETEAVEVIDPNAPARPASEKEETVHVSAAADGTLREQSVEILLRSHGGQELILDRCDLTDLRNSEGDEEYLRRPDGTVLWQNHGEDIHCKGESSAPLPVELQITYWLDGQEIAPEQLAGRSGRVRIRFDYKNRTRQTVPVDDTDTEVIVPFAAVTMAVLPEGHFSNPEVKNGRLLELDGDSVMVGYALPGLGECLKLGDFEPTSEIELPEYVELSADVDNFELSFTATVLTAGLLDEVDLSDLDDLEKLPDDMQKLQDATDELVDGVGKLLDGAGTFSDYLRAYTKGAGQLATGLDALTEGLSVLNSSRLKANECLKKLTEGLEAANNAMKQGDMEALLSLLTERLPEVTLEDGTKLNREQVAAAAAALVRDEESLRTTLSSLNETVKLWTELEEKTADFSAAVTASVAAAREALQALPADLTGQVNRTASQQAVAAAEAALAETNLSEEERSRIAARIGESIDLSALTDPVQNSINQLISVLSPLSELTIPADNLDAEAVTRLAADMAGQLELLQRYGEGLKRQMEESGQLQDPETAIKGALSQLQALSDGIGQLYEGAKALRDGAKSLRSAGSELTKGYDGLLEGMEALRDGVQEYNDEGIQKLTDLGGEDLRTVLRQFRGIKAAGDGYTSFTGLCEGTKGSVRFLIETDEIKP